MALLVVGTCSEAFQARSKRLSEELAHGASSQDPLGQSIKPIAIGRLDSHYVLIRYFGRLQTTGLCIQLSEFVMTVNRWAHGYTSSGPKESIEVARRAFGRITIANTDSAPGNDAKIAIREAWRAVNELG